MGGGRLICLAPRARLGVTMGQPAGHMPFKANLSVVGAAECQVLRKCPWSHQDALEPLMP